MQSQRSSQGRDIYIIFNITLSLPCGFFSISRNYEEEKTRTQFILDSACSAGATHKWTAALLIMHFSWKEKWPNVLFNDSWALANRLT